MIFKVSDVEKSIKINSKINEKTDLEQSFNLEQFIVQFSRIWEPKLTSGGSRNHSKIDPSIDENVTLGVLGRWSRPGRLKEVRARLGYCTFGGLFGENGDPLVAFWMQRGAQIGVQNHIFEQSM